MANIRLDTTNPQLARFGPALTDSAVNRSYFCWIPSFGAGPLNHLVVSSLKSGLVFMFNLRELQRTESSYNLDRATRKRIL